MASPFQSGSLTQSVLQRGNAQGVLLMHGAWRWEDDTLMIIILPPMARRDAFAGLLNATASDP